MERRGGFVIGFFSGLSYPIRGMRFVFREHPGLVRYWIVPVILTLLAFVGLGWAVIEHHAVWVARIWSPVPASGATGYAVRTLLVALDWLLVLLALALGSILVLLSTTVIAAPFNDALSAAVERIEGTLPEGRNAIADVTRDLVRSVVLELAKLAALFGLMTPLLILNLLLPAVGAPLAFMVGFAVTLVYLAIDYTDWPAARRGRGVRDRLRALGRDPGPFLGFGLATHALLFFPGVNLMLMPAAVAGGTLMFLDLERRGEATAKEGVGPGLSG